MCVCVCVCVFLSISEPPNIDRNAPPPDPPVVSGGGEVEDVARLQGEAIPIQEGANAILFFPFTGMAATATFFRLEGDTRVEITAATPGYMIIQDPASQGVFLVVTNFTSGDAGTYEFVASNDAGMVSTTATLIGIFLISTFPLSAPLFWFLSYLSSLPPHLIPFFSIFTLFISREGGRGSF